MRARPRHPAVVRRLVVLLLVLTLATRALVPSGWMPMQDGGTVRLVLCPAQGAMPMMGNARHHHRDDHSAADHPCAFAGLGLAADMTDPSLAIPPRPRLAALAPSRVPTSRPGRGLAAPPPPATGPPLLA